jgi:hypothetical protein
VRVKPDAAPVAIDEVLRLDGKGEVITGPRRYGADVIRICQVAAP